MEIYVLFCLLNISGTLRWLKDLSSISCLSSTPPSRESQGKRAVSGDDGNCAFPDLWKVPDWERETTLTLWAAHTGMRGVSAQPAGFPFRLQKCQDVPFPDGAFHVADDRAAGVVHELHPDLCGRKEGKGLAQEVGSRPSVDQLHTTISGCVNSHSIRF